MGANNPELVSEDASISHPPVMSGGVAIPAQEQHRNTSPRPDLSAKSSAEKSPKGSKTELLGNDAICTSRLAKPTGEAAIAAASPAQEQADAGVGAPNAQASKSSGSSASARRRKWTNFKGIAFDKQKNKWEAKIFDGSRRRRIGRYDTKEQAAEAYDRAKILADGPNSELNFPAVNYPNEMEQYRSKAASDFSSEPTTKHTAPAAFGHSKAAEAEEASKTAKEATKVSKYRGVTWDKSRELWEARLHIPAAKGQKRKKQRLGRFHTEEEAAQAYDRARVLRYGECEGALNFSIIDYCDELLEYDQRIASGGLSNSPEMTQSPRTYQRGKEQVEKVNLGQGIKPAVKDMVMKFLQPGSVKIPGTSGLPENQGLVENQDTATKEIAAAVAPTVDSFICQAADKCKSDKSSVLELKQMPDRGLSAFIGSRGGQAWAKSIAWNFLKFAEPSDRLLTMEDLAAIVRVAMCDETIRSQHQATHPSSHTKISAVETRRDFSWTHMPPDVVSARWVQDSNIGNALVTAARKLSLKSGELGAPPETLQGESIFLTLPGLANQSCLFLAVQENLKILHPCPHNF